MNRISISAVVLGVALAVGGCALDEDVELSSTEQLATAYNIGGVYMYQTDVFQEACSAGTLEVLASNLTWVSIPRGTAVYLKPYTYSNGTHKWRCGGDSEWSECDGAPVDKVRIQWSTTTARFSTACYKKCGDGSSASDCAPY